MDFFAGSCPLAQAVLESEKNPRFISIQLPEKIDPSSEAHVSGYANVADIGKRRITVAANKIRIEASEKLDLDNFDSKDLGFKVIKLYRSNFKRWQAPEKNTSVADLIQQLELAIDHIDPNASQEDLLYELLIKSGVKPTESITTIELAGHKVFSVAEGSLFVHLEDSIDKALIDAVLAQKPVQFICLDKAFHGNDQLKANAVKTFESYNQSLQGEEPRILFRTV